MIGAPPPQETRDAGRPGLDLRLTGPGQARKRMRLLAAIGMLAVAAIATGAVASLSTGHPIVESKPGKLTPPLRSLAPEARELLDPALLVEAHVEEAESAIARARAAIRSARQLGVVDPQLLDEFERRLELVAGRTRAPTAESAAPPSKAPPRPVDGSPREL